MAKVGIAADHGGFLLKVAVLELLRSNGHSITDFGAHSLQENDDYPDFVIPLAEAVAKGQVDRGVAICGSGVGASIVANKVPGVRAALIHDPFSAHQGVEDDNMNLVCLGGRVVGYSLAWELIQRFLEARFSGAERHRRRLTKVAALERKDLRNGN
ncbi:MAG: RpiB/LacA/LacB family sugar-phosphate isomerase [Desulfomonile tiedjei]|uniref:RpiB/LacA/LacB family sugar-phosphate isomerase n=1 Tax=Desulfomonile tiedjei TaxID=2358 RepID=A0A9D6V232_9BACT|nr:RpiB/LacA/LacB family sugar-phosphate isomerase [Desulfomonile tiedjei]